MTPVTVGWHPGCGHGDREQCHSHCDHCDTEQCHPCCATLVTKISATLTVPTVTEQCHLHSHLCDRAVAPLTVTSVTQSNATFTVTPVTQSSGPSVTPPMSQCGATPRCVPVTVSLLSELRAQLRLWFQVPLSVPNTPCGSQGWLSPAVGQGTGLTPLSSPPHNLPGTGTVPALGPCSSCSFHAFVLVTAAKGLVSSF